MYNDNSMVYLTKSMYNINNSMVYLTKNMYNIHNSMVYLTKSMYNINNSMVYLAKSMYNDNSMVYLSHAPTTLYCTSSTGYSELGSKAFSTSSFLTNSGSKHHCRSTWEDLE